MTQVSEHIEFDTSDVDRHVGQPVGGGQLKEPVTVTDIRRWVQAMQYPNPLHFDDEVAAASTFGRIVAPQSFTICCDVGHGAGPAIVGNIPGTHMIFGGDEWWFAGPRIYPGDLLRMKRRFVDYKVSETKFAGPTMFSRGETLYTNQRGERVAKQWSTAVRYRADVARARGFFEQAAPLPTWTEERLGAIEAQRRQWIRSRAGADSPTLESVEVGQSLLTRPIGPHSLPSLASEWRGYTFTVWGSTYHEGADHLSEAGWLEEMDRDLEGAQEDPELGDGLYHGPSRVTPTRSTPASSACHAATAMARRWARGSSTTSRHGPATAASSATRRCSTASPLSTATSPSSMPRSPTPATTGSSVPAS